MDIEEIFEYRSGNVFWRISRGRFLAGQRAGSEDPRGYRTVWAFGVKYWEHRLVWRLVNGCWPSGIIDHINGEKGDNRVENLRDVDPSINNQNRRGPSKRSKSGYIGVYVCRNACKPYRAGITINGKNKWIGYFSCPKQAHAAYLKAKRASHAGCEI